MDKGVPLLDSWQVLEVIHSQPDPATGRRLPEARKRRIDGEEILRV